MDGKINAHIAMTSLGLLGFNTDEYKEKYLGIGHDLPPITLTSFDRESEPLLLCCLHFLLSRLDYEEFGYAITDCWPYLTSKGRSNFKYAVFSSLQRLRDNDVVDVFEKVSPVFWTLHFMVKGHEVWALLRTLSDSCIEMAIKEFSPNIQKSERTDLQELHPFEENELQVMPNGVRRKSIVQLQAEGFQSINSAADCSCPIYDGQSRDHMLAYIVEIQRQVEELIITHIAKHNRQNAYMQELDERLKIARLSLDASQKRIRKSTENGSFNVLTDAARRQRVSKLERIASSLHLLEELSHSVLLTETQRCLREDCNDTSLGQLSLTYLAQGEGNCVGEVEVDQPTADETSAEIEIFHRSAEAGQRQLDQAKMESYLNDAVETLINSIDAVCACFVDHSNS